MHMHFSMFFLKYIHVPIKMSRKKQRRIKGSNDGSFLSDLPVTLTVEPVHTMAAAKLNTAVIATLAGFLQRHRHSVCSC